MARVEQSAERGASSGLSSQPDPRRSSDMQSASFSRYVQPESITRSVQIPGVDLAPSRFQQ